MDAVQKIETRSRIELDDSCNCMCCLPFFRKRTPATSTTRLNSSDIDQRVEIAVKKSMENLREEIKKKEPSRETAF